MRLHKAGVPIIGTGADSIDLAEDRKRFGALLRELGIPQPENGMAATGEEAKRIAEQIGYPVLVRPSYVLGGRAMVIVYDEESLDEYVRNAVGFTPDRPVLIDKFLERAAEFDVDALADENTCVIAAIQEHIEECASCLSEFDCVLPPVKLTFNNIRPCVITRLLAICTVSARLDEHTVCHQRPSSLCVEKPARIANRAVCFRGDNGVPIARIAALVMAGQALADF
jgi:carbamoyl-phosphate synthase large subunit